MRNVCQKAGRTYYRREVGGKDTYLRLPDPSDPAFAAAYAHADRPDNKPIPPAAGTIGALAIDFRAALAKRKLSPVTRTNYLRYVDRIAAEHRNGTVKGLRPAHIYRIRDDMADTPGAANNYLSVLRLMMAYACERDWRSDNPAAGVPALPLGEHEPWPNEVIERALDLASPMTRLALITGLCSGQRIGDVIKMQHGWHDGRIMQLEQGKTGKPVAVPMHPLWVAELGKIPRRAVTLLYDRSGRPFQSTGTLRERIVDLMAKVGRPEFTFHGLRKNAACYLVEMGLTDEQVGALTGMSPDMVRHYTKRVRVLKIAQGVARKVRAGTVYAIGPGRREKGAK